MSKPLRICFFSPYIPKHFGGGERHLLSIAQYLSLKHRVFIAVAREKPITQQEQKMMISAYSAYYHLDLHAVTFISTPLFTPASFFSKLLWTRQWDILYFQTDGSVFFSLAKQNHLHIQIPFTHRFNSISARIKLSRWTLNTNSVFTKEVIERSWQKKVEFVHYPTVDIHQFIPAKKKEKIILSVGRFINTLNSKQQDVLVSVFRKLISKYPHQTQGWKLVLVGSVEDKQYAQKVASLAKGLPVEIYHNLDLDSLKKLYSKAKIYWHAAGYKQDEYLHPQNVEHFGISTIEAMSSGVVPIVINKGGLKEIVEHTVNGFVWNSVEGLLERTLACLDSKANLSLMSNRARDRAAEFSLSQFFHGIHQMFGLSNDFYLDLKPINNHVSIVIPTYNGLKLLQKNLPAIIDCMSELDELLIVDDASSDTTVEWLIQEFHLKKKNNAPDFLYTMHQGTYTQNTKTILITLITNVSNQRFAESSNRGVARAKHPLVFLLNSDVSPAANTLSILRTHFSTGKNQRLFAVNCLEREKVEKGKVIIGGRNELWFERGLFVHRRSNSFEFGDTAWATGGSALFDKSKWLELKGFNLDYKPAYWEDIDLSYRAKKKGWEILFDPKAVVEHNHETTNQTVFGQKTIEVISFKNSLRFVWMNATFGQKIQHLCWLPYHLIFTSIKTQGSFLKGWGQFLYTLIAQN